MNRNIRTGAAIVIVAGGIIALIIGGNHIASLCGEKWLDTVIIDTTILEIDSTECSK